MNWIEFIQFYLYWSLMFFLRFLLTRSCKVNLASRFVYLNVILVRSRPKVWGCWMVCLLKSHLIALSSENLGRYLHSTWSNSEDYSMKNGGRNQTRFPGHSSCGGGNNLPGRFIRILQLGKCQYLGCEKLIKIRFFSMQGKVEWIDWSCNCHYKMTTLQFSSWLRI